MAGPRRRGIIIGAMKSGTTSLFAQLAEHPQIAPCHPKEPHYYSLHWRRGPGWYDALWDWQEGTHQVALESSTSYAKRATFPGVPERMLAEAAEGERPRLVYVVRDPVARIESHYRHMQRSAGGYRFLGKGAPAIHPIALETSEYAHQLDAYTDAGFSRDDILVLALEDLAAGKAVPRILRFFGIDDKAPPTPTRNRNPATNMLRLRPSWMGAARFLRPTVVGGLAKRARRTRMEPVFWQKGIPDFRFDPETRRDLHDRLAPATLRLGREWGIDVGAWGFTA